jgi:outer membrane murein-binding lipoprotein Lpp
MNGRYAHQSLRYSTGVTELREETMKRLTVGNLILCLAVLPGCTLVDYESTKVPEPSKAETVSENEELKAKVIELEKRIKELEQKIEGNW